MCKAWNAQILKIPIWRWLVITATVLGADFPLPGRLVTGRQACGADIAEATQLYQTGQYRQCATVTGKAIEEGEYSITWRILKLRSELAAGEYGDARATLEKALKRYRDSIRLRWLANTVYRFNGDDERAGEVLDEIDELTDGSSWRYRDPFSRVTLGRHFLHQGVDPKEVLDGIYNEVKRRTRSFAEPYIAAGELALDKHDYQLAADEFAAALELDTGDPNIHLGLARAFSESDSGKSEEHLRAALKRNPQHTDSLLFLANNHIDAERYDVAGAILDDVAAFHPSEPRVWAYRAVLAHLDHDRVGEEVHRQMALAWWKKNPEVDHLIGAKLSQKYRFKEGAEYQRSALRTDPRFLPAKMALSQDLMRLGEEEEGWRLASEVYDRDGYNVVAHNLVMLRDQLAGYTTLDSGDFHIRMDPHEAAVYGDRVLQLLERAKQHLSEKYEIGIDQPVLVEIFPRQQDFAIRTFGLPGGAGYLGVCFGAVITANSPASQADAPANWEAVLWHEFCHVVTLKKTQNKMPRWLSEGISVYEERQANSAWGQTMTPQYREMILGDDLTAVSQLSGAFLQPKSPLHLQFAYFESYLVVEYLVEQYGIETLNRILVDLGVGMPLNASLGRYVGSLSALDDEFADYAKKRAESLAPEMDWERPELEENAGMEQWRQWNRVHADNYWGLRAWAALLMTEQRWEAAKQPLNRLLELFPEHAEAGNAYVMLAKVHRELSETNEERAVLERLAERSANAVGAYGRLMELAAADQDWVALKTNAVRMLAVNPLQRPPHRYLSQAADELNDDRLAVEGLRVLALMDPHDPADVHYRLATRLHSLGATHEALRHILRALEEAPRFRAAHRKLLEIVRATEAVEERQVEEVTVEDKAEAASSTEPIRESETCTSDA